MGRYTDETEVAYNRRRGEWVVYLRGNEIWSERLKSEAVKEARRTAKGEAKELPADQKLIIKNKQGEIIEENFYESKL